MKRSFAGGCAVGLVIGVFICCIGASIISVSYRRPVRVDALMNEFGPRYSESYSIKRLGQYELADSDAVKEFNSRVKNWFIQRGYEELEDIPLRSINRMTSRGHWSIEGNWDIPGVLLYKKFDDQNSVHILIPDCYDRARNIQMIGYYANSAVYHVRRDSEIQLDKMLDDFERAFPSGDYKNGLPDDMP